MAARKAKRIATFPTLLFGMVFFLVGCGPNKPDEVVLAEAELPETIDFNFHIKPILSDRCFACHGPDKNNQKANLRLDSAEEAYKALSSGSGVAIKPGSLGGSEVYHRMVSKNPDEVMPPPESNLELTPIEIAYIAKWIEQGAEYKPHWAFTKPDKPEVPELTELSQLAADRTNNEIDRFVFAKLRENNIEPSPQSQRETLVRRLFFDLVGLPPSIETVERLMADDDPDYYEKLVDSLLDSSAYGERMAAHWLDVARFADSEGYLDDFHHDMHPYRDWVIDAYNKNLPYDDFVLWQVGGDQIPNATREQRLATAFNRLHKQNSEGGAIAEEFRVEYVADRANTVGAAFMGLTVACARCHDHKYDPFSQKNYFELFSFFNSTVEMGNGVFAKNALENGQQISPYLSMNAGPVMAVPDDESVLKIREFLLREIDSTSSEIEKNRKNLDAKVTDWATSQVSKSAEASPEILKKAIANATKVHLTFDDAKNGTARDLARGAKNATYQGQEIVPGKRGMALKYGEGKLVTDGNRTSFERSEPFTVSFWIKVDKAYDVARILYNGNGRNQGYRGWEVVMDSSRVSFRLNHAYPFQSVQLRMKNELPSGEWHHFSWTYDGSSDAKNMRVYQNGELAAPEIVRNNVYRSTKPYLDPEALVYERYQGLVLGASHYDQGFDGGTIDEFRVLDREIGGLEAKYLFNEEEGVKMFQDAVAEKGGVADRNTKLSSGKSAASTAETDDLDKFYALHVDADLRDKRDALRNIRTREVQTIDSVPEIMVMGDLDEPRPTYILDRGAYDSPTEEVDRNVPSTILPWPEDLPRNRYGLGKWLIHEDNPLTARVAVNQIWYLMFGRGLVETNEDFGNQGALPTHPKLLDWLAVDFMENGWNVKRLVRQMVTSATYKQSSVIRKDLEEIDPDNKLLARSPRYRRSAEMVRDNVLAASGLLDRKVGGRSVFPYQPDGLWRETIAHSFFPDYEVDYDDGLYRRSLYTFWKRNAPAPTMLVFDAANRSECQVKRLRSNTPLQALVLLNSPQILEACRVLSEKTWKASSFELPRALDRLFLALIGRTPTKAEREILLKQYEGERDYFVGNPDATRKFLDIGASPADGGIPKANIAALARVANTVLNTTEAYYKN